MTSLEVHHVIIPGQAAMVPSSVTISLIDICGSVKAREAAIPIMTCNCILCRLCEESSHTPADLGFPCLDPTQLKLSHVDNFWKTVETSVATGQLVLTGTEQPDITSSNIHAPLLQLDNTIIILPRVVTRVRPVHEHWEDHVYQDLAAWDVDFVIQMLQRFLQLSSAKTVPSLAEYRILPDKVGAWLKGYCIFCSANCTSSGCSTLCSTRRLWLFVNP